MSIPVLRLVQPPEAEPVTLAEARAHLRIDPDNTTEDLMLGALIKAAREQAEHVTGRAIMSQTWEVVLDAFPPAGDIELPKPRVLEVQSVIYVNTARQQITVPGTDYALDAETTPGWLLPAYGKAWPADVLDSTSTVRVRFRAGYGDTAAAVPASIKAWMLMQVGALYRNREAFVVGAASQELAGRFFDALLDSERVYF